MNGSMLSTKEQEQARMSTLITYFQHYVAVLAKAIRQGKEKSIRFGKGETKK